MVRARTSNSYAAQGAGASVEEIAATHAIPSHAARTIAATLGEPFPGVNCRAHGPKSATMRRMRALLALSSVLAVVACGSEARHAPAAPTPAPTEALAAALTIPAGRATAEALAQLHERNDTGARAVRIHYLLDLFDDARFRGDDDSLRLLAQALGLEPRRGSAATDRVIDALLVEVDDLLAQDRLQPLATATRTLLMGDRHPPSADAIVHWTQALHQLADAHPELRGNVSLRLAGACERAFRDAAAGPPSEAWSRVVFCMATLEGEDPADYREPAAIPSWRELGRSLIDRYREANVGRLAGAADNHAAILPTWLERNADRLPTVPDVGNAPEVSAASPYLWVPLLTDAAGAPRDRVDRDIAGDGRGAAAWLTATATPAVRMAEIAALAVAAGASELQLLVRWPLPRPDAAAWWQKDDRDPTLRAGVLSFTLAVDGPPSTRRPRTSSSDLDLAVVVGAERWRLAAGAKEIATVAPSQGLDAPLAKIMRAFPDVRSITVIPGPGATMADIARAAADARFVDGHTRLAELRFAPSRAVVDDAIARRLRARIDRRAAATVTIEPAKLAERAPIVLRCYQDILDRQPRAALDLELELRGTAAWVTRGPKRGPLWACAVPALSQAMVDHGIRTATVRLHPGP